MIIPWPFESEQEIGLSVSSITDGLIEPGSAKGRIDVADAPNPPMTDKDEIDVGCRFRA
jgi:hypothetical protein